MRAPSSPYCRLDLAPPSADRFIFGVAPIDYGPVVLLMPFGFHLAMDTLPSEGLLLRPTTHYRRLWIWHPSFECQRDFNPPEQRAAQHTLQGCPTSQVRSSSAYVLRLPDASQGNCGPGQTWDLPVPARGASVRCSGSVTARDSVAPRDIGAPDGAFRIS